MVEGNEKRWLTHNGIKPKKKKKRENLNPGGRGIQTNIQLYYNHIQKFICKMHSLLSFK